MSNRWVTFSTTPSLPSPGHSPTPRPQVVAPPRFDVGIDVTPLVDGPSVQATVTQDELRVDHFAFCSAPAGAGPPSVISADTGIHPSAAGYAQMASALPTP
jgi:hypothetical protein